jgi:NTE family protein
MEYFMNRKYKPESLVFEGGGVLGLAYAGVYKTLEENNMLDKVKHVAGTSAGSMSALLIALGYDSKGAYDILWNTNFKEFMDSRIGFIRDFLATMGTSMGWNQGKKLIEWIKSAVKRATGNPDTRFGDLAEKQDSPYLVIPATNLSKGKTIYFDTYSTPDVPLWFAVRASMSIPFYFEPVVFNKDILVDGALSHNYPIDVFDHDAFISSPKDRVIVKDRQINLRTIGFSLKNPQENKISSEGMEIKNGKDKARAVAQFMMKQANRLHVSEVDIYRTVIINVPDMPVTKFDLTQKEKESLMNAGIDCTLDRLNSPLPEIYSLTKG